MHRTSATIKGEDVEGATMGEILAINHPKGSKVQGRQDEINEKHSIGNPINKVTQKPLIELTFDQSKIIVEK